MKPQPPWAAELFHPNLASSFLLWKPEQWLWAGDVCWYECLRHACLGRNLSPGLYSDLLLSFVSSEYYHGANHSMTFKFSLLRNFQPGRKQYLCLLSLAAVIVLWAAQLSCCSCEESGPYLHCTALSMAKEWKHMYLQKSPSHHITPYKKFCL